MASIPPSPPAPTEGPLPPPPEDVERDEYEDYIEGRLHQTRRQVKSVDLAASLLTLFVGTLVYLLAAAIFDHWVITGGLSFGGRLLLLAGLLVAGGYYFCVRILPLLIRRINPIFAAHTIEQSRPSLKNGLVNFLFLRHERREHPSSELARRIYQGLEEKTAAELADPAVDTAVDRSEIIRLGYVLIAVVALCALYLVFSPKNPLASFGRVILPWAKIQAPTRVAIRDVQPGNHKAFQGDTLTISADVTGIDAGEPVALYYTTSDGQSVNQAVPMTVPEKQYRYFCNLPPGSAGLQQDLEYYVAAGDARTERFQIHVEIPLTILVDRVHYEYPKYTGIPDRDATSGDIRAIEGTKVTVSATASQPIQRASVEMNSDSLSAKSMTVKGTQATRQFILEMDKQGKPKHTSYQLRFTDTQDRTNPRPIRHVIEVIPDLPPEVRWIDPPDDKAQLPVNGAMDLKLRAEDPDYALQRAEFHATRGGMSLPIAPLLEKRPPEPPHRGAFEGTYRFEPSKLGLKAGDQVVVWAEADDNRRPLGNHSKTDQRTIDIVEPQKVDSQQGTQQKPGENPPQEGQPDQNQQNQTAQGKRDQNGAAPQDQMPEQQKQDPQPPEQQQNEQKETPQQEQKDQAQQQNQKPQEQKEGDQQDEGSGTNQGGNDSDPQGGEGGNEGDKQDQGKNSQQQQQKQQQDQTQGQSSGDQQGPQENQGQQNQGQQGDQGQEGQQGQQGKNGEKSTKGSQGQSAERQPVDPQTDAGQAFEKILEDRQQQDRQSGGQSSQPQPKQQSQPSQSPSQKPDQQGPGEKTPQPDQSQQPQQPQQPQQDQGQAGREQPQQDQPKEGQSQAQQPGTQQDSGENKQQPETPKNSGAQPQPDTKQAPDQQSPGGSQEGGSPPQGGQSQSPAEKKPSGGGDSAQDQPSGPSESSPSGGKGGQPNKGGSQKPEQKSGDQPSDASLNKDRPQPGDPQSATGQKPPEGQGDSGSAGKQTQDTQSKPGEKAPQQPGDQPKGQPQPSQGSPGSGKPSAEKQGAPTPQQTAQPVEKRPAGNRSQEKPNTGEPASPNTKPKESDSQGDTGSDRSGGGERGGGQKTPQPGTGSEGSQKEAQDGGQVADQPGKGETGSKPGQQAQSDQTTDQTTSRPGSEAGKEGNGKPPQQPDGKQSGESPQSQSPQSESADGDAQKPPTSEGDASGGQQPSDGSTAGSGNPTQGGVGGEQTTPDSANPTGPLGADDPNLDYANKQTDLALDHLRHEMTNDRSDLLDRLGWTKKDAEQFIRQWEQLKQEAGRQDDQGQAARKELKDALDSLGLRPRGTQLEGGHTGTDRVRGLHEDRRFAPPKEYAEQVQAYTKGLSEAEEPSTTSSPPPKAPGR